MTLLFLYGPPAVGKYTVAKVLAKRTGFRLFHNHLTTDLVASLFAHGTKPREHYTNKFRLELLEAAARENIPGVIFTYVYAKTSDDWFVQAVIDRVKKHGGKIRFVRLTSPQPILEQRVVRASRRPFRKIKTKTVLRELIKNHRLFDEIPHAPSLSINTSRLSPIKTAEKIQRHYRLPNLNK